jgi:hypothetical protein
MKKLAIVVAAGFVVAACMSTGNKSLSTESELTVASKIEEGVTTAEEVKAMYGSPFETTYTDGGSLIWKYRLDDMQADAVNYIPLVNLFGSSMSGTRKELVILFDENDVVRRANMSESAVKTGTGVFK